MLANYDAGAVAAVMGLGFVRAGSDAATSDFLIWVGGETLTMIEVPARTGVAGTWGGRPVAAVTPAFIEKAVERGLPREALRHVAEALAGGDAAKVAGLEWGVVPKTTLERRVTQLSPQESERTERVARLFVHARRALGTAEEARVFMTTPHPELDGRRPLDSARTDLGARRTEQLLNALEFGLAL